MPNTGLPEAIAHTVGKSFAQSQGYDHEGKTPPSDDKNKSYMYVEPNSAPSVEVPMPHRPYGPLPIIPQQTVPGYRDYGIPQTPQQKDPRQTT
jgi:hypothetical protein